MEIPVQTNQGVNPGPKWINITRMVGGLLLLAGLGLASLVPGGPIETRDFSHIPTPVLLTFNLYLTGLGLASIWFGMRSVVGNAMPASIPVWTGIGYIAVYGADLAHIFPKTHSAMPLALLVIEWAGIAVAILILWLGRGQNANADGATSSLTGNFRLWWLVPGLVLGAMIVAFAAVSAAGWL